MLDCVMLDVGGTFVKYGAVNNGAFLEPGLFPIKEDGTAEEIIRPIVNHLKANPTKKVAISIPGPMDYPTGTSHMAHKFVAIKEISLKAAFEKELPGVEFCFVHDAAAYILGEVFHGAAAGIKSVAGVMLGTGLGFVLFEDGKVRMRSVLTPCPPLWNIPWEDGICEDYVSARGMRRRWLEATGKPLDVKEIADLARQGDQQAIELMSETGRMLGEMLTKHLEGANAKVEKIVIGGQISKSFDLMQEAFEKACSIPACPAQNLNDAALRGAWEFAQQGDSLFNVVE